MLQSTPDPEREGLSQTRQAPAYACTCVLVHAMDFSTDGRASAPSNESDDRIEGHRWSREVSIKQLLPCYWQPLRLRLCQAQDIDPLSPLHGAIWAAYRLLDQTTKIPPPRKRIQWRPYPAMRSWSSGVEGSSVGAPLSAPLDPRVRSLLSLCLRGGTLDVACLEGLGPLSSPLAQAIRSFET